MKNLIITLCICGLIISCSGEPEPINGYFKREYSYDEYNNNSQKPFLVRISGDTMVQYFVIKQSLDSSTYIWNSNKSGYYKLGESNLNGYPYNRPAFRAPNEKVVLKIDTTGYAGKVKQLTSERGKKSKTLEEILVPHRLTQAKEGSSLSDTLIKLPKEQFLKEIVEQKIKDSLEFFHPHISDFFADEQIRKYISFYMEDRGDFISNSLEINRQADDIFHGKFRIRSNGYFSTTEAYIYKFDFNENQMKARRIN